MAWIMRDLAILSFVTLDGVMQSPTSPEEDPSGGFTGGGWGAPYWAEVMPQVYCGGDVGALRPAVWSADV